MLIKSLDEIRAHVPYTFATSYDSLKSFIEQAERTMLIPEIGQQCYDDLQEKYDANTSNPDYKTLLKLVQAALSWQATVLFIPSGQLHISDAGIRIQTDDHHKQAFDWQIQNLEESCQNAADSSMEVALSFLELKKNVFTAWASSESYTQWKQWFVNSAALLNSLVSVQVPRRIFSRMLPEIRKAQVNYVMPVLCTALYNELVTQWTSNSLSPDNKKLMALIQPAIAHIAIAKSVSGLALRFTDLGISTGTNSIMKQTIRQAADAETRSHFIQDKMNDGQNYIRQLEDLLYAAPNTYPLWRNSPCYKEQRTSFLNNTSESGLYIV